MLVLKAAASSMSLANPRTVNSLPELHCVKAVTRSFCQRRNTATAASASGDNRPCRCERIAPAPIRSSRAVRKLPFLHLSPAGIIAILVPCAIANCTIVSLFRKQPASVGFDPVCNVRKDPLGEGNRRFFSNWTKNNVKPGILTV